MEAWWPVCPFQGQPGSSALHGPVPQECSQRVLSGSRILPGAGPGPGMTCSPEHLPPGRRFDIREFV